MRTAERNRMDKAMSSRVSASIQAIQITIDQQLDDLDQQMDQLIQSTPIWQAKVDLLTSFKGVGNAPIGQHRGKRTTIGGLLAVNQTYRLSKIIDAN